MFRIIVVSFTLAIFLLAPAASFGLVKPPEGTVLPDFDIRKAGAVSENPLGGSHASSVGKPLGIHRAAAGSEAARAALERLGAPGGETPRVTWNPLNGSARFLRSPGGPLTGPSAGDPADLARKFLAEYGDLFGLGKGDLVSLEQAYRYKSANNGVTHLFFQQQLDSIDVFQGYVQLNIAGDGSIVTVSCGDTASSTRGRTRAVLGAADAVRRAALAVGMDAFEPARINSAAEKTALFDKGPMLSSIPAEPVYFPMPKSARAAWRIALRPPGYPAYYQVIIDAENGALLLRRNLTKYVATQGLVFWENPDETPQAMVPFPDDTVFVDPSSPVGWVFTNVSRGNNVDAKEDHAGDDETTIGVRSRATGTPLTFGDVFTDIWETSGGATLGDTEAADTNVFYWTNFLHDRTYKLGFTEAAGNFQVDNFGLGGLQNDPVLADIQDGYDQGQRNNAFSTPLPDGQAGRASFFLFDNPRFADSDFDGDIVFHELTHLVSSRLVGGPGGLAQCLGGLPQSGAIGEGTSDFVAASIFSDPVVGEYSTGDPVNGVRHHPLDANAYTYADLCTINFMGCEVHDDGEIWGEALWKMRAAIIGVAGSPAGIGISEQLLIDGMKFSPCLPSFLDLRDAILAADFVDYGAAYHCTIWQAFASSGMGFSAVSDPDDQSVVTAASDLPAACTGTGGIRFNQGSYNCRTEGFVILVDSNASVPVPVQVVTSSGDAETFQISTGAAGTFQTDPFPITEVSSPGEIVPGNSRLEVIEGDTLTATYNDINPAGNTSQATATISCDANVGIVRYYFADSNCANDQDAVTGFPNLPGFLDAGESADLVVEIANRSSFDIEDAVLTAACDNPNVLLVPTGGLAVGTLKARKGTNLNPTAVTFHVAASNSVASGEQANITFGFSALGFRGVTTPLSLSLDLNHDYRLVSGEQFHEDFEGASAADWVHGPTDTVNLNDEWALVSCNSHSPTHSYHDGGTDCSDYSDDQGNPYLASPAVDLFPPGTVGARVTGLDFFHNVDLGGIDFASFTEGDLVAVGLAEANVTSGSFVTLATYGNIPFFGLDDNTNGAWVEQNLPVAPADTLGLNLQAGIRAAWVFLIDVLGDSPTTDIVGNGYYLDDVTLTYDRVEETPQIASCGKACNAIAWANAVPNPVCRGQSPVLDASQSGLLDCPSGAEYRWTDGAGFDTGYAAANVTATPPAPTAQTTYTLEVRCTNLGTPCSDSMDVTVGVVDSLPDPAPTVGNQLRVTKAAAGGVRFDWSGALTTPEFFNLHHTSDPLLLANTPAAIGSTPAIPVDQTKAVDITSPTDAFYEVWPRNGCTNISVIP